MMYVYFIIDIYLYMYSAFIFCVIVSIIYTYLYDLMYVGTVDLCTMYSTVCIQQKEEMINKMYTEHKD